MGMLSIRNMNWTVGAIEQLKQDALDKAYERVQVRQNCELIRKCMTQADFDAWWNETPNDNDNFNKAVSAKLAELKQANGLVSLSHPTPSS